MIVLASKSTGRLATLRAAGIDPQVRVSDVDEPAVLADLAAARAAAGAPTPTAAEQVQALAHAKALDVAASLEAPTPEGEPLFVVGCDSMLEIEGQIIGKPRSAQAVRERWAMLSGNTGTLHTGHTLVRLGSGEPAIAEGVSSAVVHFASPSPRELEAYIATEEPQWCAGAFTIDGFGGAFVEGIEGDPHGVVGISLPLLRRLVTDLGGCWTDLWRPQARR